VTWRDHPLTTIALVLACVVMYVLAYGYAFRWGAAL
jgi:hypothetical protein